jgi:tetratricopeptide (TPR) repeat protein
MTPRSFATALACAAFALPSLALGGVLEGDHPLVRQGTEAYQKGDYDGALRAFEEASRQLPGRAELQYNLGDVYMKLGRPDDAKRAFEAALSGADDALKARDYFNLGNALASLQQKQDAAAAYRQALKADPHFEPARHNLELLLRKPPEENPSPGDGGRGDAGQDGGRSQDGGQPKEKPDGGSDGGLDGGGGAPDESRGDGGEDGGRPGDGGQGADGSAGEGAGEGEADGGSDGGDGGSQDANAQPGNESERPETKTDPKKVDQQEAERLLDAMRRNEKQFLMMQHTKKAKPRAHPERDW